MQSLQGYPPFSNAAPNTIWVQQQLGHLNSGAHLYHYQSNHLLPNLPPPGIDVDQDAGGSPLLEVA
jgi:hypothetical protein